MKTKRGLVDFELDPAVTLRAGAGFRLAAVDAGSTPGYPGRKSDGARHLEHQDALMEDLQERLFASAVGGASRERVLLVLQAMDTAGKGGIVTHVVSAMDPQGVHLKAFKAPTEEEKAHGFLWRIEREIPTAGMVGVFDRSHYEDVLIHRVHGWADEAELERRYTAINAFEARLRDQGTTLVKVLLHLSKDEQKARLLARLRNPAKHWKYTASDLQERGYWNDYQEAFQIMLDRTSTETAPWYVVPADKKWYARIAVQQLLIGALEGIDPQWPPAEFDVAEQIAAVKAS